MRKRHSTKIFKKNGKGKKMKTKIINKNKNRKKRIYRKMKNI